MKILKLSALSAALCLALVASGCDRINADPERTTASNAIAAKHKADEAACQSLAGNFKDICIVEAKGRSDVAKAELEVRLAPSDSNRLKLRTARADAAFALAKERCDDFSGNAADVCIKEAQSEHVAAKADARLDEKTAAANATARRQTADAKATAQRETGKAAQDAADAKHKAAYAVDREKCEAFSGDVKDTCIKAAKARHGQI